VNLGARRRARAPPAPTAHVCCRFCFRLSCNDCRRHVVQYSVARATCIRRVSSTVALPGKYSARENGALAQAYGSHGNDKYKTLRVTEIRRSVGRRDSTQKGPGKTLRL